MIKDWHGKSVIVTGAGTGIGRAVSHELASRGAIVYVTGLDLGECQTVARDITAKGFQAIAAQLDVNNWDEFKAVMQQVKEQQGKLDVLINNAGILFVGEFYDMDEHFIEKLVQTNITSVTVGTLYAYRLMKEQGHGLIINIASIGGFSPTPTMAAYAACKHAVIGLTNSLVKEAAEFSVDIRAVCFGLTQSALFKNAEMKYGNEQTVFAMLPVKPLATDIAAKLFIDQVAKDNHLMYVPFSSRLMWWLSRFFPSLLYKGAADTIKKYREISSR